jgi:hypothetical protein
MEKTNEPRTLTEAQINANRENAKKSTGPCTAEGKAKSSRNRLLHGLRANKHILLDEHPEDFLLLLKSLDDTFRPVGEAEEMLVTQIAADQWRLDRALPMEAGIFRERLEYVAAKDYRTERDLVNHRNNHASNPENVPPAPAPPNPDDRLTRAFIADCDRPNSLANLTRYKAAIQLSIDRTLRQLKIYQAARIASQGAQAVPPATTPPKSANYHSNPTHGDIAKFSAPATPLMLSAPLHGVPQLMRHAWSYPRSSASIGGQICFSSGATPSEGRCAILANWKTGLEAKSSIGGKTYE